MNRNLSQNLTKRSLESVWHPYTQMMHHESFPLVPIKSGKGSWLYDFDGNEFLDAISSWWVCLFGHGNEFIKKSIVRQLDEIEHTMLAGFTHEPVIHLSENLSALTNMNLGHVFYSSDGASAVEISLKMSYQYWKNSGNSKKKEFICLKNSYHGETLGALNVSDIGMYKDIFSPMLSGVHVLEGPDTRLINNNFSEKDMDDHFLLKIKSFLGENHEKIASFILEPLVQGAAGMVMYSSYFLKNVCLLCRKYNIHVIADEIAVGCGRTGTFFAMEQAGEWPDFITLSKGISGGFLPLSLVMTTDHIYNAFYHKKKIRGFLHSHTYTGNPLACSAALSVLKIFDKEKVIKKNKNLSDFIFEEFKWIEQDPKFSFYRRTGMMFAFDVKKEYLMENFPIVFFSVAIKNQILLRPIGNTIYFVPPYTISKDEIRFLSKQLKKIIFDIFNKK